MICEKGTFTDHILEVQFLIDLLHACRLTEQERSLAIEQGEILEKMQSTQDSEETLSCLPTLTLADIPHTLPHYDGVSHTTLGKK